MKAKVIISHCIDPWENLALEEYYLKDEQSSSVILMIWQCENAVVVGKHQNIWKECNISAIHQEQCKAARRITGGGTVYHDLGNVNFSFITPVVSGGKDQNSQFSIVMNALKKANIEAELSHRKDILVQNKKISGNAFYKNNHMMLHHGTLLVSANLIKLSKMLKPANLNLNGKSVASIRSEVTNIQAVSNCTTSEVKQYLIDSFCEHYPDCVIQSVDQTTIANHPIIQELFVRHAEWDWIYGGLSKFNIELSNDFEFGHIRVKLSIQKGRITDVIFAKNKQLESYFLSASKSLIGHRFIKKDIAMILISAAMTEDEKIMANRISDWIKSLSF